MTTCTLSPRNTHDIIKTTNGTGTNGANIESILQSMQVLHYLYTLTEGTFKFD